MSGLIEGITIGMIGSFAGGTALYYLKTKMNNHKVLDFCLDRFKENGKDFVGIHNTGIKKIDACSIYSDGMVCAWSEDGSKEPRIIASCGGGNVSLPTDRGYKPVIRVKSGFRVLKKIRLLEITTRK